MRSRRRAEASPARPRTNSVCGPKSAASTRLSHRPISRTRPKITTRDEVDFGATEEPPRAKLLGKSLVYTQDGPGSSPVDPASSKTRFRGNEAGFLLQRVARPENQTGKHGEGASTGQRRITNESFTWARTIRARQPGDENDREVRPSHGLIVRATFIRRRRAGLLSKMPANPLVAIGPGSSPRDAKAFGHRVNSAAI
jgi:hypothetical protein